VEAGAVEHSRVLGSGLLSKFVTPGGTGPRHVRTIVPLPEGVGAAIRIDNDGEISIVGRLRRHRTWRGIRRTTEKECTCRRVEYADPSWPVNHGRRDVDRGGGESSEAEQDEFLLVIQEDLVIEHRPSLTLADVMPVSWLWRTNDQYAPEYAPSGDRLPSWYQEEE